MFALSLLAATAFAADPEFVGTTKDGKAAEKAEYALSAEVGGALTTGNSEFYTLSAGMNGRYKRGRHQLKLIGGGVVGAARVDADGDGTLSDAEKSVPMVVNATRFFGDLRYDIFISEKDSFYALYGIFHDPFAGYDWRMHEQIGYSRHLVKTEKTQLIGEIGVDWAQENYIAGTDPNTDYMVIAARGMLSIKHKFNDSVGFEETFEVYENVTDFEDLRIYNSASFTAALGAKLALKLSHSLIFDNQPVPDFRKLDQTMQLSLVASIL